jgi:hypothetical protein
VLTKLNYLVDTIPAIPRACQEAREVFQKEYKLYPDLVRSFDQGDPWRGSVYLNSVHDVSCFYDYDDWVYGLMDLSFLSRTVHFQIDCIWEVILYRKWPNAMTLLSSRFLLREGLETITFGENPGFDSNPVKFTELKHGPWGTFDKKFWRILTEGIQQLKTKFPNRKLPEIKFGRFTHGSTDSGTQTTDLIEDVAKSDLVQPQNHTRASSGTMTSKILMPQHCKKVYHGRNINGGHHNTPRLGTQDTGTQTNDTQSA